MSKQWEGLNGEELSAFVANGHADHEREEFAEYLEQHGTERDFANWVESNPKPIKLALSLFRHCPTIAHTWLITALTNNATPTVHYDTLMQLGRYQMFNQTIPAYTSDVLQYVDLSKIEFSKLSTVFRVLLKDKSFALIEDNWDIFLPVIIHDPVKSCIDAAHNGWDLRERLPQIAIPLESANEYFTACCVGGVIERARLCNINPDQHEAIINAFVLTMSRNNNNDPVLNYLWDAYPNTPWHNQSPMLSFLLHASVSMLQKIVDHHRTHAPEELEGAALYLTSCALSNDCPQLYDLMLPFIGPTEIYKVVYSAIAVRNEKILTDLLQLPNGEENFAKALKMCAELDESERMQWGTEVYNKYQNQVLHKNITSQRQPNPKKKM